MADHASPIPAEERRGLALTERSRENDMAAEGSSRARVLGGTRDRWPLMTAYERFEQIVALTLKRSAAHPPGYQNSRVARRAPSAMLASFAHTMSGSTAAWPTHVPNPQSVPAMTCSRPTSRA